VKKVRALYNQLKIEEANGEMDGMDITDDKSPSLIRMKHWKAKAYYFVGDYKTCLELCN
jgi:hypothetical protein